MILLILCYVSVVLFGPMIPVFKPGPTTPSFSNQIDASGHNHSNHASRWACKYAKLWNRRWIRCNNLREVITLHVFKQIPYDCLLL